MLLKSENKALIDNFMDQAVNEGIFPGAVLGIVNQNEVIYQNAFGYRQIEPEKKEMNLQTIFDLASLTKVVAATTAVMQLIEKGKINLWDYLGYYYPELPDDKQEITIYHLLTHSSGFQAIVRLWEQEWSYEEKIQYILKLDLENKIGSKVVYSDPNFILLGDIIKRVTGDKLDVYAKEHIFEPLGMKTATFNPLKNLSENDNLAATEFCTWRGRMLVGEVHDENTAEFAGISGHAGMFSTLNDLCIFLNMLLSEGIYKGIRILSSRAVKVMRTDWTPNLDGHRGLGWDLINNRRSSGGVLLSPETFGHTGFTGTSLWIDPVFKLGVILLTNRVHPTRQNQKIIAFRPRLHNLIASILFNN